MKSNRFTTWALCLLAASGMMLSSCSQGAGSSGGFKIKRGTNLSHWLSQSWERGEARAKHIQEDDFARLEELGFEVVKHKIYSLSSHIFLQPYERGLNEKSSISRDL